MFKKNSTQKPYNKRTKYPFTLYSSLLSSIDLRSSNPIETIQINYQPDPQTSNLQNLYQNFPFILDHLCAFKTNDFEGGFWGCFESQIKQNQRIGWEVGLFDARETLFPSITFVVFMWIIFWGSFNFISASS